LVTWFTWDLLSVCLETVLVQDISTVSPNIPNESTT
jgi:hypothetical protein